MILPLFGGLSEIELLNALLGGPKTEGPELCRKLSARLIRRVIFKTAWSAFPSRRLCFECSAA